MSSPYLALIYDRDCPACRYYIRIAQIESTISSMALISARDPHPLVTEAVKRGFDLNEGFVLVVGDEFYHGDQAIHQLALLSSQSPSFNRFNYWVFSSSRRARFVYPILAWGRHLLLWILGIKPV